MSCDDLMFFAVVCVCVGAVDCSLAGVMGPLSALSVASGESPPRPALRVKREPIDLELVCCAARLHSLFVCCLRMQSDKRYISI